MYNNLPTTYEEYGKLNDFGPTEMESDDSWLSKKLYEQMVAIINKIKPLSDAERDILLSDYDSSDDEDEFINFSTIDFLMENNHMSQETYEELIDFIENVDIPIEHSFVLDELAAFFDV